MDSDTLLQFWAKKRVGSDGGEILYPLLFHMLDTAMVAGEIWDSCLQSGCKRFCAEQLGTDEKHTATLVSFWAGLHDIGKASPGFQCKDEKTKLRLKERGFDTTGTEEHGTVSARLLKAYLRDALGADLARNIATTVGGHHGVFPRSEDVNRADPGRRLWPEAQRKLYDSFSELCGDHSASPLAASPSPAFFMLLAGLTSVADWIASNETYFPIAYGLESSLEISYARKAAHHALTELAWKGWQPPADIAQIQELFPGIIRSIDGIRPLQHEAVSLAHALKDKPGLVIIEAPTGEGKTEAAMYLADTWAVGLGQKGCYFALPTMATSDQMFGRMKSFLETRYHDRTVNLMLLHGHAALSAGFESLLKIFDPENISGPSGYDGAPAGVVASEWFTYRKRGLLAPFGVGTVDQALLAVLQTRHVFVRLFGLAGKTVIIDEVHANDTYMTTLLERLLEWLAAMGSSVVMLSATLPGKRKNALLEAYVKGLGKLDASVPTEVRETRYPRISWTEGDGFGAKSVATSSQSTKNLNIRWVNGSLPQHDGEFGLGRRLEDAIAAGGCAAVICNTVDRAQVVYSSLKPYFDGVADDGQPVLDLLHARYLFGDRKARQERSEIRFGKQGANVSCQDGSERPVRRPNKAVLVATQVIEQSLDLDFDLMVTDMAPVDLLLQRAGRMHRHLRTKEERHGLAEPVMWVCEPEMTEDVPDFGGGTEAVYDYHVLLRTWLAVKDKPTIEIPEEVEDLIEAVYDERECPEDLREELKGRWEKSRRKHEGDVEREKSEAEERWIKWPGYSDELCQITYETKEEDDPSLHKAHQALTRLTGPTLNVICVYGTSLSAFLDRSQTDILDLNVCPNTETATRLLKHSVSISRQDLIGKIVGDDGHRMPAAWRGASLLRHHYILFFDEQSLCHVDTFEIRIDDRLGLTIEKVK